MHAEELKAHHARLRTPPPAPRSIIDDELEADRVAQRADGQGRAGALPLHHGARRRGDGAGRLARANGPRRSVRRDGSTSRGDATSPPLGFRRRGCSRRDWGGPGHSLRGRCLAATIAGRGRGRPLGAVRSARSRDGESRCAVAPRLADPVQASVRRPQGQKLPAAQDPPARAASGTAQVEQTNTLATLNDWGPIHFHVVYEDGSSTDVEVPHQPVQVTP